MRVRVEDVSAAVGRSGVDNDDVSEPSCADNVAASAGGLNLAVHAPVLDEAHCVSELGDVLVTADAFVTVLALARFPALEEVGVGVPTAGAEVVVLDEVVELVGGGLAELLECVLTATGVVVCVPASSSSLQVEGDQPSVVVCDLQNSC